MKHYFFLDETGDHGLSFIDKSFPLFFLCGCLFTEDDLKDTQKKIDDLKQKYFKTKNVILHSRDIRKCEGAFQILFNLDIKAEFYKELNEILINGQFKIIGAGINKEEYIKRYGKGAQDPYSMALTFIVERLVFCLGNTKDYTSEIAVEKRGKKEDRMLMAHFNSISDKGTFYVTDKRMKYRITKFEFFAKRDNIAGLQIADLCAYPLARHILNPDEPYVPFQVIKDKIYCDAKGEYKGWGLKIFP